MIYSRKIFVVNFLLWALFVSCGEQVEDKQDVQTIAKTKEAEALVEGIENAQQVDSSKLETAEIERVKEPKTSTPACREFLSALKKCYKKLEKGLCIDPNEKKAKEIVKSFNENMTAFDIEEISNFLPEHQFYKKKRTSPASFGVEAESCSNMAGIDANVMRELFVLKFYLNDDETKVSSIAFKAYKRGPTEEWIVD